MTKTSEKSAQFSESSLSFLKLASKQTNADWIEKNKLKYNNLIIDPLLSLDRYLKAELSSVAQGYHFPQKAIGRIKRSSNRVGPDMKLYKDWVSYIMTTPSKSRFEKNPLLFFGLLPNEPEWQGIVVAGGLYMASSLQMKRMRQAIAENSEPFKELFSDKDFKKTFKDGFNDTSISKKCPRGFDENHPDINWIRLKTFFVSRILSAKEYTSPQLNKIVTHDFKQLLRLNHLIQKAIDGNWS